MADLTLVVQPRIAEVLKIAPQTALIIKTSGAQGPAGRDGTDGGSVLTLTAGAVLSGHRLLTTDGSGNAVYADSSTLACANAVIGLSLGAAQSGASVTVQAAGEVTDPSFAFTPGQTLWLGTNGMIATATPSTGFSLVIGYAMTATTIFLNIGLAIFLI